MSPFKASHEGISFGLGYRTGYGCVDIRSPIFSNMDAMPILVYTHIDEKNLAVEELLCHHSKVIKLSKFKGACSDGSPTILWSQNHSILPKQISIQLS